jgi:superfamily I DNA/RNA helicase
LSIIRRLRAEATLPATAFDRRGVTQLATGELKTLDNQIDTTTGTLKLQAEFANEDEILFPNQFVNIKLLVDVLHDSADMVPLAVTIVQTSEIARNAIRQTYSHVFFDEFQDCTKEQYELITACFLGSGAKLIAVGDTKQRIMGWAGALEGIFKTYAADFGAKPT